MTDATYLRAELEAAEPWHFWFQARRRLIAWSVRRYFPGAQRMLDLGCGTGFILDGLRRQFTGARVFGCDLQPDALASVQQRLPDALLLRAAADRLPFADAFDVILALDVIEHLDADDDALRSMFSGLRPGGGLVVTVPQHPALWSQVDEFSHHRRRYRREELERKVRLAGFEIVRRTSCFMATLPLLVLSRGVRRETFDPASELRLPRWVNALLKGVVEVEWTAIRAGVSLPAGGSLLMIARRPYGR